MGHSVDDLLNAIKQEYEDNNPSQSSNRSVSEDLSSPTSSNESGTPRASSLASPSPITPAPTHPLLEKAESIDDLLEDLGVASQSSTPLPTPFSTVRESGSSSSIPASSSSFSVPANQTTATDSVLAQVKQQYAAEEAEKERKRQESLEADRRLQRQLEEQARQQQLAEERRQRELEVQRQREWEAEQERLRHLEEQRKAERLKKAQDWLKELDPNSDEGFWFESFAVNYASKLDAALEYLSAMEQAEG